MMQGEKIRKPLNEDEKSSNFIQEVANQLQKASKRTAASGTYTSLLVFPLARSMGPLLGRGWEPS